ncbi:hypothetical protein [Marinimicrobium agarilyticum]|uniref:hypothetical protein n=1 Tax=Marinimicrobium agarilyticum TaxID=306546 RepID=UPI00048A0CFF|nr:hypothetical protein [Marinimicrobium agarilyticum]
MLKFLYFFISVALSSHAMAFEIEQIESLHESQIEFLEGRVLELDACVRYFRSSSSDAKLVPICSIFSRLNTEEEKVNSERRWNALNQAYSSYITLVEEGSISAAKAKIIERQRNRIADLLDASADRVEEFLELYERYKN